MRKIFSQHLWFWSALFGWCFITAVGAWALIFAPFDIRPKKFSEFSVKINGVTEDNQLLVCNAPLRESLESVTDQWQAEGWKCITGILNLAPLLSTMPKSDQETLDRFAQLRCFKKGENFRLLGFLGDSNSNQTYEWICEIPAKTLEEQKPFAIDFPLKPPQNAVHIFTIKAQKVETCIWSLPFSTNPEGRFIDDFTSQGFNGRLWSKQGEGHVYLLQRGSIRLLASIEMTDKKETISVVKLDRI